MIKDNLSKVYQRISSVCSKINIRPDSVTIVAVSKGRSVEEIKETVESGVTDIGENRIQEALLKYKALSTIDHRPSTIRWHMVGHLQTNKVKDAVKIFDLIHSVDSARLAAEMDKQALKINKVQDILIEIKTSPEATKSGIKPDEAIEVIKEIDKFKNINIKGLMTIAPLADDPQKARPYFRMLRELMDKINALHVTRNTLHVLSMGMTDDFEIAIEEGSTMIRLGRAIFGDQTTVASQGLSCDKIRPKC